MERKPLKTFRSSAAFAVSIAVWEGEKGCTFSIQKRIKDQQTGEYKDVKSYYASDLLALAHIAKQALAWADNYSAEHYVNGQRNGIAASQTATKEIPFDDDIPF